MFNNKPTVRPEDHVLPECFQFGTESNKEIGGALETAAFIGTLATGAFTAFNFLTQAETYMSNRNAANRQNGGSWF